MGETLIGESGVPRSQCVSVRGDRLLGLDRSVLLYHVA